MRINDTLYSKYLKVRQNIDVIENEAGFISYKLFENECFIADCFVDESFRQKGHWRALMDQVTEIAKSKGCSILSGQIDLRDERSMITLLAALKIGCKVARAEGDVLLMIKKIREN